MTYIIIACIVIPVAFLLYGIHRRKKHIKTGEKEPENVVEVLHRGKRIRMTATQKEGWDKLSRQQKTNFLKSVEAKKYKVGK